MAKKLDAKAKAKRQKIIAIGGAVVLLGLLAIQVPRTMKMLNASAPAPAPTTETAPGAVPETADPSVFPTPGSAGGAEPAAAGGATLVDSDTPPAPEAGQLVSFGRFASKDPFAEQIDDSSDGGGGGDSGGGGGSPAGDAAGGDSGTSTGGGMVGGSGSSPGSGGSGSSKPPASGAAVISVNGVEEPVSVKGEFPKDEPVFVLVSVSKGQAKVAIAGGAFASGAPTITLRLGKAITLVNTADGVRYELKLVSTG